MELSQIIELDGVLMIWVSCRVHVSDLCLTQTKSILYTQAGGMLGLCGTVAGGGLNFRPISLVPMIMSPGLGYRIAVGCSSFSSLFRAVTVRQVLGSGRGNLLAYINLARIFLDISLDLVPNEVSGEILKISGSIHHTSLGFVSGFVGKAA